MEHNFFSQWKLGFEIVTGTQAVFKVISWAKGSLRRSEQRLYCFKERGIRSSRSHRDVSLLHSWFVFSSDHILYLISRTGQQMRERIAVPGHLLRSRVRLRRRILPARARVSRRWRMLLLLPVLARRDLPQHTGVFPMRMQAWLRGRRFQVRPEHRVSPGVGPSFYLVTKITHPCIS
jgi:hypothetical protein